MIIFAKVVCGLLIVVSGFFLLMSLPVALGHIVHGFKAKRAKAVVLETGERDETTDGITEKVFFVTYTFSNDKNESVRAESSETFGREWVFSLAKGHEITVLYKGSGKGADNSYPVYFHNRTLASMFRWISPLAVIFTASIWVLNAYID